MNPENPALVDLGSIRSDLGEDYLREFVSVFLEETPKQIQSMQAAMETGTLSAVAAEGHKLKGNFGYIAASGLSQTCLEIEQAAKASNTAALPGLVSRLISDYQNVEKELERVLHELPE